MTAQPCHAPSCGCTARHRDQEHQSDCVGDHPRRDEQRTSHENHRTLEQHVARHTAFGHIALNLLHRFESLGPRQGRSDETGHEDQCEGFPPAEVPGDPEEQGQFKQGNGDEEREEVE